MNFHELLRLSHSVTVTVTFRHIRSHCQTVIVIHSDFALPLPTATCLRGHSHQGHSPEHLCTAHSYGIFGDHDQFGDCENKGRHSNIDVMDRFHSQAAQWPSKPKAGVAWCVLQAVWSSHFTGEGCGEGPQLHGLGPSGATKSALPKGLLSVPSGI